jgi:hypothetical protein
LYDVPHATTESAMNASTATLSHDVGVTLPSADPMITEGLTLQCYRIQASHCRDLNRWQYSWPKIAIGTEF